MPFGPEWIQAVAVPVSDIVEHFFAFSDGKSLALKIIGQRVPDLAQRAVCVFMRLRGSNDLPQQNSSQVVTGWTAARLGILTHLLLAFRLLGVAFFLTLSRLLRHLVLLGCRSLSVTDGHASNKTTEPTAGAAPPSCNLSMKAQRSTPFRPNIVCR